MSTTTNWARLKELAIQRRDGWGRRLAEATARHAEAQRKLKLLDDYRREYLGRMDAASRGGIHGDGLRNFRTFLANLDRAIEQQTNEIGAIEHELATLQAGYASEQRNADSFDLLAARQVAAGAGRERREQQKLQDEYASRPLPRFLTGAD